MSDKIFINYRRSTDHASAGRLYDQLENAFGKDDVFFDVDGIDAGSDFVQVLSERVSSCGIFLAIIGNNWINVLDDEGYQRISDHNDWVRIEIESALQQNKRVIPVLIDGASMPRAEKLPPELSSLVRRQAVRINHEQFRPDVQRLVNQIIKFRTAEQERRQEEARRAAEQERQQEEARGAAEQERRQEEARGAAEQERRQEEARGAAEQERQQEEARRAAEQERRQEEARRAAEQERRQGGMRKTVGEKGFKEETHQDLMLANHQDGVQKNVKAILFATFASIILMMLISFIVKH